MSEASTINVILPRTALWAIICACAGLTMSSAWFVVSLDKRLSILERGGIVTTADIRQHEIEPWHPEAGRRFAAMQETLRKLEKNSERQADEMAAVRELLTKFLVEGRKK